MATSNLAYIYVAASNGDTFTNAFDNDMLIYPAANNQRILIGNQVQGLSTLTVGSNVGVNYSNPPQALSVGGNLVLSNFGQTILYSSNQFLGIGVSNPTTTLTVGGGATITGDLTINNAIGIKGLTIYKRSDINANISSTSVQGLSNDNTGLVLKTASNNHAMSFYTSNLERARITSDGIMQLGSNTIITGSNVQSFGPIDYGTVNMSMPGTITGTVPTTSNNPFNISTEGALSFNGTTGNFMTLSNSQYLFNWWTTGFTLEAWVNYASFTNASKFVDSQSSLIGNMQSGGSGNFWSFGPLTTRVLNFFYWTGAWNSVSTTSTIPLNTWTHIALSCDGTNIRLFINGTLSQTAAITLTPQVGYNGTISIGQFDSLTTNAQVTNIRLVRGSALYTASFTPSTTPLTPATTGTTLLLLRVPQNTGRAIIPKIGGGTQIREYPPVALTGATTQVQNSSYGTGTYYATTSTQAADGNSAYTAFDKVSGTYFQPPTSLYRQTSPFDYTGTVSTIDTTGNTYMGEWLQLQLPCSILLSSFTLTSLSGYNWSYPNTFQLLGSLDGVNWSCLDRVSGNVALSSTYTVNASQSYSYYRLVIFSQNGASANNSPTVSEFILYGSQESIVSSSEGQVGIGVVRPVQPLEVAGNAMFYGSISANNMGIFRNRVINGDMRINQRGFTSSNVSGGNILYSPDRFFVNYGNVAGTLNSSINTLTISDAPFQYGFQNSFRITNTSVTSFSWIEPGQYIEGYNIQDLNWGTTYGSPVTLSFWFRTNSPGSSVINAVLRNQANTANYAATFTVNSNVWQYCSTTIPPPTIGSVWNSTSSQGIQLFIGSHNNGAARYPNIWSTNNTSFTSLSTNILGTASRFVEFTGVQLEKGTMATPFEFRPFPIELQLCQRYYETSYPIGTSPGTNLTLGYRNIIPFGMNGSTIYWGVNYKVPKRAINNTITLYSETGTINNVTFYSPSGGASTGSITSYEGNHYYGFTSASNYGSTSYTGGFLIFNWVCNSEL